MRSNGGCDSNVAYYGAQRAPAGAPSLALSLRLCAVYFPTRGEAPPGPPWAPLPRGKQRHTQTHKDTTASVSWPQQSQATHAATVGMAGVPWTEQ